MSPPSSWAIITRAASRDTRNEPLAITSCCRSQSATVVSSSGLDSDSPALLTTRSTPPNASTALGERGGDGVLVGDVDLDRDAPCPAPPSSSATCWALSRFRSATTTQAPSAATRCGDGLADARAGAGDERDPGGQRLGPGHPRELGLLEGPVLDAELLRLRDRGVGRHRLGAAHHVDRVDVELAGDPGGLLVLAEGEHAHPGHQHDRRVRAADRRRVRGGVAVVVGLVVGPVGLVQLREPGEDLLDGRGRRAGRRPAA